MQDERTRRYWLMVLSLLLVTLTAGCASMPDPGAQLEKEARQFAQRLRWGDWDAAAAYIAPDARDAFVEVWRADRDLNLVEVQVEKIEPLAGDRTETRLAFDYYRLPSTVVRHHTATQSWQFFPGSSRLDGRWELLEGPLPPP